MVDSRIEVMRAAVEYDPVAGLFLRTPDKQCRGWFEPKPGGPYGRRVLPVRGTYYTASHVAWALSYNYMPEAVVVLIDKPLGLRLSNLWEIPPAPAGIATAAELRKMFMHLLHYDAFTGLFKWHALYAGGQKSGWFAGSDDKHGYRTIRLYDRNYFAHRLAWLFVYGEWPSDQIDHENGIRDDNRIVNLRDVSNQVNSKNASVRKNNNSGVMGVHQMRDGAYEAYIMVDYKKIHLGRRSLFEDAVALRKSAEAKYEFHGNHGKQRMY